MRESGVFFLMGMIRANTGSPLFSYPHNESVFVRKGVSSLPVEQIAPDSVFAPFSARL